MTPSPACRRRWRDLRALSADNPPSSAAWTIFSPLVANGFARVARLLEAGRTPSVAVLTDDDAQHARETMDHIRTIVASMTDEENERERSRTEAVRAEARVAGYPLLTGTLLSLAIIVFVFTA